jgi:hypothetical protein
MRGRVADCTDEWPPFHVHSVAFLQALALGDYLCKTGATSKVEPLTHLTT